MFVWVWWKLSGEPFRRRKCFCQPCGGEFKAWIVEGLKLTNVVSQNVVTSNLCWALGVYNCAFVNRYLPHMFVRALPRCMDICKRLGRPCEPCSECTIDAFDCDSFVLTTSKVTIASATVRGFPWKKVPIYILAQVLGALCGAGCVYATYYHQINLVEGGSNIRTMATAGNFATYAVRFDPFGVIYSRLYHPGGLSHIGLCLLL